MRLDHKVTLLLALLGATLAVPALSQPGEAVIGRVLNSYVRESRNFYIEEKILHTAAVNELWVEVSFARSFADDTAPELYRVPARVVLERGDLVATRAGEAIPRFVNLLPELNQVTELVARRDTPMAMRFVNSGWPGAQGFYTEARGNAPVDVPVTAVGAMDSGTESGIAAVPLLRRTLLRGIEQ